MKFNFPQIYLLNLNLFLIVQNLVIRLVILFVVHHELFSIVQMLIVGIEVGQMKMVYYLLILFEMLIKHFLMQLFLVLMNYQIEKLMKFHIQLFYKH
jgi:hypothetical protein